MFCIIIFYAAISTVAPKPLKVTNISLNFKSKIHQGWSFFTNQRSNENYYVYNLKLDKFDLKISSKSNDYGFTRKSRVIKSELLDIISNLEDSLWTLQYYKECVNPKKNWKKVSITNEYLLNYLDESIIIEKRSIVPWEWRNDSCIELKSKFVLVNFSNFNLNE
ncbi:SdpA family antimicrobial peptide system protein [Winogradskyella sp.]|uniref:SdpA family antimicrobial peptide system protein n=1 Tax=Winogradskyella sp. TaxID=1883156 RepID=UPI0026206689|nr:SdpA family antimicrobial peptide system protein [Winogradskyella sp.]